MKPVGGYHWHHPCFAKHHSHSRNEPCAWSPGVADAHGSGTTSRHEWRESFFPPGWIRCLSARGVGRVEKPISDSRLPRRRNRNWVTPRRVVRCRRCVIVERVGLLRRGVERVGLRWRGIEWVRSFWRRIERVGPFRWVIERVWLLGRGIERVGMYWWGNIIRNLLVDSEVFLECYSSNVRYAYLTQQRHENCSYASRYTSHKNERRSHVGEDSLEPVGWGIVGSTDA